MTKAQQRQAAIEMAANIAEYGGNYASNFPEDKARNDDTQVLTAALRLYAACIDPQPNFLSSILRVIPYEFNDSEDVRGLLEEALRLVDAP
jgi:hypothetical protein